MNTGQVSAALLGLSVSAAVGFVCQRSPIVAGRIGLAADEIIVDHRESPYTDITWVASETDNALQLRFFRETQGSVCLHPALDRSMGAAQLSGHPPEALRHTLTPGILTNTMYGYPLPIAVLLHDRLMAEAASDPRAARPHILIIGLGAGAGINILAHHFPMASFTVVEIDPIVAETALTHQPFLRWLRQQQTADGRHRFRLVVMDARTFIRQPSRQEDSTPYDVVVADAYASGATIPPHLLTSEFYRELAQRMASDGIVLSNIKGSYTGPKHLVLGGAIRTMRKAGFDHVLNVPVLLPEERADAFGAGRVRNNLVLASRVPLDPDRNPLGWKRLELFQLYPELPEGRFVSAGASLGDGHRYLTTSVPLMLQGIPLEPELLERLRRTLASERLDDQMLQGERQVVRDPALIDEVIAAVQRRDAPHPPRGWEAGVTATELIYWETDWVALAREVFERSVHAAAERSPRGFVHSGELLVASGGSQEPSFQRMDVGGPAWTIADAPLFTDAMANADLLNR